MPIPVLACPYFQALFIVLVLRECQALSEEELKGMRETEIWLSYLEKLKTAKWLRWTRCGHSETLMAETQADGWSANKPHPKGKFTRSSCPCLFIPVRLKLIVRQTNSIRKVGRDEAGENESVSLLSCYHKYIVAFL